MSAGKYTRPRAESRLSYLSAVRTYSEVAHILHLSKARVQQIEVEAFRKLRKHPKMKYLLEELAL